MLSLLLAAAATASAATVSFDPARCRPQAPGETPIYSGDFKWSYTLPELTARYAEAYPAPKRLAKRAYWDESLKSFLLPYMSGRGPVVLPASFVASVVRHIEGGLEKTVVDGVFFPDMGHSHFLIPDELWESKFSKYPTEEMGRQYTDMMSEPRLKVLYHTAEQLQTLKPDGTLVDDERTRFRFRTRNLVGRNDGSPELEFPVNPESKANTVGEMAGYQWWGAGFNVSANAGGCFAFTHQGREYRFDLSLYDLEPAPGTVIGDYSVMDMLGLPLPVRPPTFGECESLKRERLSASRSVELRAE